MANVPKILTGVDLVDQSWGGFYQGGSYLCFGHAASGRGLMAMLFLQTGITLEERCLFISPGRPQDWFIQASTVGFDMDLARQGGLLDMMWIPSLTGLQYVDDQGATQVLDELITVVHKYNPSRLVINDFMPFLQFHSFERFREQFTGMLEAFSDLEMTLMIMAAEPMNQMSLRVIEFMQNHMSGALHIAMNDPEMNPTARRVSLYPGLGHQELKVVSNWDIPKPDPNRVGSLSGEVVTDDTSRRLKLSSSESESLDVQLPDGPYPSAFSRPSMVDTSGVSDLGIQTFYEHLQKCFQRYKEEDEAFLLVAVRLEQNENKVVPAILFELLVPAVQRAMRVQDQLFVDMDRERLIVLMPGTPAEYVSEFFGNLQQATAEEDAQLGENLLNAFTAIVVPDGQPFGDADEFMEYVLEA